MRLSKLIKGSLISLVVLGMIGGNLDINVDAKRSYHYRTHRVYRRHTNSRRSMFSYFTPGQIKHFAKLNGESVKEFKSDSIGNDQGAIYGPAKVYKMDDFYIILTSGGIRNMAKINHMSVKAFKYDYLTHSKSYQKEVNMKQAQRDFNQFLYAYRNRGRKVSKYWYKNDYPTSLLLKTANRDAIKKLNQERVQNGVGALTPNPYLQKIADNYTHYQYYINGVNPKQLTRYQRKIYYRLKNKYSPISGASAYDMYYGVYMPGYKPWSIANEENRAMQHYNGTRLSPNYTQVGISIGPIGGGFVEEFGDNSYEGLNANSLSNGNSSSTDNVKEQTLKDLSQDRASVNESPLSEDSNLDNEAQRRSQELVSNFSHQNNNGQYASDEDSNVSAENIAYISGPTGKSAANSMNQGLFYNEEASDGGHYQNIVNSSNVGVGVTVKNGTTYLAEDFN